MNILHRIIKTLSEAELFECQKELDIEAKARGINLRAIHPLPLKVKLEIPRPRIKMKSERKAFILKEIATKGGYLGMAPHEQEELIQDSMLVKINGRCQITDIGLFWRNKNLHLIKKES
jgi:hypothetical protein